MNIFENMSQSEHDRLIRDEDMRSFLDSESERIGKARIEKSFETAEWMTPDEFGDYLKNELKWIYKQNMRNFSR